MESMAMKNHPRIMENHHHMVYDQIEMMVIC